MSHTQSLQWPFCLPIQPAPPRLAAVIDEPSGSRPCQMEPVRGQAPGLISPPTLSLSRLLAVLFSCVACGHCYKISIGQLRTLRGARRHLRRQRSSSRPRRVHARNVNRRRTMLIETSEFAQLIYTARFAVCNYTYVGVGSVE